MLTINGTLRQHGELTITEKPFIKLWVEHETPRADGVDDLQIVELLIPRDQCGPIPAKGAQIGVNVRAYPVGRDVKFQALGLAGAPQPAKNASDAAGAK
jgi:hypothetical protein